MKKKILALALAAILTLSLAACGGAPAAEPTTAGTTAGAAAPVDTAAAEMASGGVATYGIAAGWDTLTPGYWCSTGYYGTIVWSQIYDKLINITPDGYTPRGALSWESNADKTVLTFTLNPDAKFSDGEPVTAEDWVFSAKLLADPDFGAPDYSKFTVLFAGTDETGLLDESQTFGVEALDTYTLQMTFKEAMTFDTFFCSYAYFYYVLPAHCFEGMSTADIAADTAFWANPVCSGPWTVESEVLNSSLTLAPNTYYHAGAPKLDNLILQVMDSSNFAASLMSGSIDYCYPAVSTTEAAALEVVDSVAVETSSTPNNLWFFCVNNQKIPDVQVRKAINMAMDKELIANQLFAGGAIAVESVELYGTALYNNDLKTNFDPEGAKALLDEAGWDYETVIHIASPSGIRAQIATIIEQNLESIGMNVEVSTVDIGTMYAGMHGGDYEAIMGGGTPNMDPLYFQGNLEATNLNSSIIKTNDTKYHDYAIAISLAGTDEEKTKLVMEYQQYMYDQQVTMPIAAVYSYAAHTTRLSGIDCDLSVYYNDDTWNWTVTD